MKPADSLKHRATDTAGRMPDAGGTASGMRDAGGTASGMRDAGGTASGMRDAGGTASGMRDAGGNTPPDVPDREYRPVERFWPYVNLPEQPTAEELAALNPELAEALFGASPLPFSISIDFPRFEGADYARAVEMARRSAEYRETGSGATLRHRARFYPPDAGKVRDLFEIVGRFDASEVLIDDRPVPYARELWLPLLWFLIR